MQEAGTGRSATDQELIEKAKKGDFQLLDGFYRSTRGAFFKWIFKTYQLTEAECEDIYQDAFEVFYKKMTLGKLDNLQAGLKSYLFSIGKYMLYEKFRNRKEFATIDMHSESRIFETEQIHISSIEPDEEELQIEMVMHCKKSISTSCSSIIDLFYIEKQSMKEIANLLGYKNADVVKSQKVRCLTEIRKCMEAKMKSI